MNKALDGTVLCKIIKVVENKSTSTEDLVVQEVPLTIYLNGKETITMLCSPGEEEYLVLGFLKAEGMVEKIQDVSQLQLDLDRGLAWVQTTMVASGPANTYLKRCLSACCGNSRAGFYFANDIRTTHHVESDLCLTAAEIYSYVAELDSLSVTFNLTGGVHGGALVAAGGQLIRHCQDIGRHNVLDKLFGYCLKSDISTTDKALVFSGRISSEIVLKVSKMNVPVLIACSAPTSLAISLAEELGITIIGFARAQRMNIYANPQRIIL